MPAGVAGLRCPGVVPADQCLVPLPAPDQSAAGLGLLESAQRCCHLVRVRRADPGFLFAAGTPGQDRAPVRVSSTMADAVVGCGSSCSWRPARLRMAEVDRVRGVLEQVRAGRVREAVGYGLKVCQGCLPGDLPKVSPAASP
jgi:hypothetical protein